MDEHEEQELYDTFDAEAVEEDENHNDSNDEEEDAWLKMEVMRLTAEEAEIQDPDAYKPQLMDENEMRSLRRELRTNEARVERDGHMREYVPHKPSTAGAHLATSRRHRFSRSKDHQTLPEEMLSDNDDDDAYGQLTADERRRKREYAKALQDEVRQFSKLYEQYEDTKRLLLHHLDMICSTKPSERVSSATAYDALQDLLAFAAECNNN